MFYEICAKRCVVFALLANCVVPIWRCEAGDDGGRASPAPSTAAGAGIPGTPHEATSPPRAGDIPPAPQPGSAEERIVDILRRMPDWTRFSLNGEYSRERAAIEHAMAAISVYDLDTIRSALEYYSRRGWFVEPGRSGQLMAFGKELILNKYLFALPASVRRESPHFRFFGEGWWGLPISGESGKPRDTDEMSIRWPWSEDESGRWRLTGTHTVYMSGK